MNFLSIKPKYRNKKILCGEMVFDSKKEFMRYLELKSLEEAGEISELRRQVKYVLIPAQREKETVSPRGRKIPGKVIEREVAYFADFVYREGDELIVEDVKSPATRKLDQYILKRKMLLYFYGIRIREI